MPKIDNTSKAFVVKIQALYDIEMQLEKVLPKLARAANNPELKKIFLDHLEETKMHRDRLEQIFDMLDVDTKKTRSEGIRGIIEDGSWVMDVDAPIFTKDSMLVGAARYAEHYEMAGYMSAIEEAKALGLLDIADLLSETLVEEENADKLLCKSLVESLQNAKEEISIEDEE